MEGHCRVSDPVSRLGNCIRDNGKENGNYYSILELYRGNGNKTGNFYSILGLGLCGGNRKENGKLI